MVKMFFSVFGQTPKHVFFTDLSEVLYCFCHLGWGGVVTRDGLMAWAYLTPMLFGLCPSTGCKYGSGLLALSSPLSGWVWGSLLRRSHAEGCTPARVWRGARGRSAGTSS